MSALRYLTFSWRRLTLRHWRRAPWTHVVMVLIVALGVGSFFSVRLAGRAAASGFDLFAEAVTGGSDLIVETRVGEFPTAWLSDFREALGSLPVKAVPVLETTVGLVLPGSPGAAMDVPTLRMIGIDLLAVRNVATYRGDGKTPAASFASPGESISLGNPDQVYLSSRVSRDHHLHRGSELTVIVNDTPRHLSVAAVLPEDGSGGSGLFLVMDLPALQRLTGREDRLDHIELVFPESLRGGPLTDEVIRVLMAASEGRWVVRTPDAERASAQSMTMAFRFNLSILSSLALLVGLFLILQALEANVLRRRSEIGVLRMLGAERRWLLGSWMAEALTLGVVGSGLGLLLGFAGAQVMVRGVAGTVSSFYHQTTVSAAGWHGGEALLAGWIGVVASLAAGWLPARDAANTPPVHAFLRQPSRTGIRLLDHPMLGAGLLLAGWGLTRLPPVSFGYIATLPVAGYLAAVAFLTGTGILFSALLPVAGRLLRGWGGKSPSARYALSHFRMPSGRHKLTVAGLVLAVGMAAGMVLLIHSFQVTLWGWIDRTLTADVFMIPKGQQTASGKQRILEKTWRTIASDPAVASTELRHGFPIEYADTPIFLTARTQLPVSTPFRHIWVEPPRSEVNLQSPTESGHWQAFASESFCRRFGKGPGDEVTILSPAGEKTLRIMGMFADYGNERGSVEVGADPLAAWFGDRAAMTVSLVLRDGVPVEAFRTRLQSEYPGLNIRSQALLREEIHRLFRDTFSITLALQAIGVTVAVAGLGLAMISLMLERRRELAVLRELGMTRRGIAGSAAMEGGLTAGLGLLGGLVLSFILGWVLIFVINRQSFGWTLSYAVPWGRLALLGAGILVTGTLVSGWVGHWGASLKGEREG
ncbi:MAG: ABC transporter permease [Kiritimatiellae bacterium]|nr:ABC transporter permease [Kiritimatiellia bacterium]